MSSVRLLLIAALAADPVLGSAALRTSQSDTQPQKIEWNSARRLRWRDFAMKAPARSTDAAHSWVGIDTDWSCNGATFVFHVTARFDPARSWVKSGSENGALLGHEQTHFDLTEVAARQMRKRMTEMKDPCRSFMTMREIDAAIVAERQAWDRDQHTYDRETDFGTNAGRQQFWARRIQDRLAALSDFQ